MPRHNEGDKKKNVYIGWETWGMARRKGLQPLCWPWLGVDHKKSLPQEEGHPGQSSG